MNELSDIFRKISRLFAYAELTKTAAGPTGKALIGKPASALTKWAKEQPELEKKIIEIWDSVVTDIGDRANYGGCWGFFVNRWNKRFREGKVPVACKYEYKRKPKEIYLPNNTESVEDFKIEEANTDKLMKIAVKSTASAKKRVKIDIEKEIKDLNEEMSAAIEKAKNKKVKINDIPSDSEKTETQKQIAIVQQQVGEIKNKIKSTEAIMDELEKNLYVMQYVPVTSVDFEKEMQISLNKITNSNLNLEKEMNSIQDEFNKITKEFDKMVKKKVASESKEAILDPLSMGIGAIGLIISFFSIKFFWSMLVSFLKHLAASLDTLFGYKQIELERLIKLKNYAKLAISQVEGEPALEWKTKELSLIEGV